MSFAQRSYLSSDLSTSFGSARTVKIHAKQNEMSLSPWRAVYGPVDVLPNAAATYQSVNAETGRAVAKITFAPQLAPFTAKTALGKRLVEIRQKAIAQGLQLLTEEEIRIEIERRRGEVV